MSINVVSQAPSNFHSSTFVSQELDSWVTELETLDVRGDYDRILERASQILKCIRVYRHQEDRMVQDSDVEPPYIRAELKTYCALVQGFLKTNRFQEAKGIAESAITVYYDVPLLADEEVEYFYDIIKARLSNLLATACFAIAEYGPVAGRDENIKIGIEEVNLAYNLIDKYIDNEPDEIFDDNLLSSIYLNQVRGWAASALKTKRELDQLVAERAADVGEIATIREQLKDQLDQALLLANTALEEYQPFDMTLTRALQDHERELVEIKERYFPVLEDDL